MKGKQQKKEFDLEKCETLDHLKEVPKRRAMSITSIESDGSMKNVLASPSTKNFDDLKAFEAYLQEETWDNDFDYCHAHLSYYPPFIMKEIHGDPEKIKDTMNKKSHKFVRNLKHHVKRHLMAEMEVSSGYKMDFKEVESKDTPTQLMWRYEDCGNHGFSEEEEDEFNRRWKLQLEVSCNNENPMVEVDYLAIPV